MSKNSAEALQVYLEDFGAISCYESVAVTVKFENTGKMAFKSVEIDCVEGLRYLGQIIFHDLGFSSNRDKYLVEKLVYEIGDARSKGFSEATVKFKVQKEELTEHGNPALELAIDRRFKRNF